MIKPKYCYEVNATCVSGTFDKTYGATLSGESYIACKNGYLYVIAESPAEVEKIVRTDCIESIKLVGLAYSFFLEKRCND